MMAINAIIMKIFSIIDFCYRFSNLTKLLFIPSSSGSVRWFISFCLLDFYLFWEFCFNFLSKTHPPVYPPNAPLPKNFCRPCPFGFSSFLLTGCVNIAWPQWNAYTHSQPDKQTHRYEDFFLNEMPKISIICASLSRWAYTGLQSTSFLS